MSVELTLKDKTAIVTGSSSGIGHTIALYLAKAGIIMLIKSIAAELGPLGINVNAIAPGLIETEMTEGMLKNPKTAEELLTKIPLARTGKPEDIASVVHC